MRFRPLFDKLYLFITIPTLVLLAAVSALVFIIPDTFSTILIILADAFVLYFLISPLFGYVELQESAVYIKFGLILKRQIPYSAIRAVSKERRLYADSMVALKCATEHINIKYNRFDVTSVSVVGGDELIRILEERIERT